jgi:hypothetical protein
MQGYLSKQGGARGGFKTWHRRWIVLKEEALYYYKSEQVFVRICASLN